MIMDKYCRLDGPGSYAAHAIAAFKFRGGDDHWQRNKGFQRIGSPNLVVHRLLVRVVASLGSSSLSNTGVGGLGGVRSFNIEW